jgi:hypothetical protein
MSAVVDSQLLVQLAVSTAPSHKRKTSEISVVAHPRGQSGLFQDALPAGHPTSNVRRWGDEHRWGAWLEAWHHQTRVKIGTPRSRSRLRLNCHGPWNASWGRHTMDGFVSLGRGAEHALAVHA